MEIKRYPQFCLSSTKIDFYHDCSQVMGFGPRYILTVITVQVVWRCLVIFLKLVIYCISSPRVPIPVGQESSAKITGVTKLPRATEWAVVHVVDWPNLPFLLYCCHSSLGGIDILHFSLFFFFPQSSGNQLIPFKTSLFSSITE